MDNVNSEVLTTKKIICERCGKEFEMSPAEQKFYLEHDFSMPKKCDDCRKLRRQLTKLTCVDCNAEFEISELEKEYYTSKGFQLPKRCKACREIKRVRNAVSEDDFE